MLYVIVHVLPYAASSPFHSSNLLRSLLLFRLSLQSPSSLFFRSRLLFPFLRPSPLFLNFGTLYPRIGSLSLFLGRFQGLPRLSYKAKTRLERVDIHSTRVRPTFTMQTWISMVSPNKYHEVSRCWPRRIASLPPLTEGKLFSGFEIMVSLYEIGRNAYVLSRWVVSLKR